ncbi:MAG: secretin N-terminal domain-containing protein [Candidatus Omnitrophica bacterium]|nr:secretin N-terminal domain-containing protein [Candidatus Omnitrophota bacterium]
MRFSRQLLFCSFVTVFLLVFAHLTCAQDDKTVTLDVQNMNIDAVVKMIADQSGMNVALSNNVIGTVTVKLDNVSVIQALDSVLKANNYLYSIENGIISVYTYQDSEQQERFVNLETRVFTLGYTDVADLKKVLLSMKTARGRIETNEKNNQVIVTDTPEKVKEIEIALKELDQPTETKEYKLLYSKAKDVEPKILQVIPKEKGDVYIDERTNSITVRATPVILKNIDNFIGGWDSQHKQVLIESMILEVTLDEGTKLGIQWQQLSQLPVDSSGKAAHHPALINTAAMFASGLPAAGPAGFFKIGSLTADEYNIAIDALKSNANTEVLSSPRIVVIDNEKANILIGSSEPYAVATTDPITHLLVQDIKYVDVGVKLEVTPQIGEDNYVTMKIHPEVSTARRVPEVDNVVAKDTTQADTVMMVRDGETIVLGGLIKNQKKLTVNKIPILGDLPLFGLLFRNKNYQDQKREVIVFVTPHILTNNNRQTLSRQQYQNTINRTKRDDAIVTDAIEKSGGVLMTPVEKEKKSEAIRKDIQRLLDGGDEY